MIETHCIRKDSWHYRFNKFWIILSLRGIKSSLDHDKIATAHIQMRSDTCEYWRLTAYHMFMTFVVFVSLMVLMIAVVLFLYILGYTLFTDVVQGLKTFLVIIIFIILLAITTLVFSYLIDKVIDKVVVITATGAPRKQKVDTRPPGLFITRYRAWKEKTCLKIKFE